MKTLTAVALALTLGCGASKTPATATPEPTPTPLPVIVVRLATFRVLSATPAAGGGISLPASPSDGSSSPAIEFEFTYPRDLTLGVRNTNFQVSLVSEGRECLATQIAYATRLDRSDGVYVANSAARFRTSSWVIRDFDRHRCGTRFATDQIVFDLGPDIPSDIGIPVVVRTGWTFVVR
jgi:hypothetical protein